MAALAPVQTPAYRMINPATGTASDRLIHQSALVGINIKEMPVDKVHSLFQKIFFEKDPDFWLKGGEKSAVQLTPEEAKHFSPMLNPEQAKDFSFKLTYDQAKSYLDDEYFNENYTDRLDQLPITKEELNAIFPCGVKATMFKNFQSLDTAIDKGYKFSVVHFLVQDNEMKKQVEGLLEQKPYEFKINIVVANVGLGWVQKALEVLSNDLQGEYALVCDPTFAQKLKGWAEDALKGRQYRGIASVPIKDWKDDMNLYGYTEKLGTHEKAAIAWAKSDLNFKARELDANLKRFTAQPIKQ